MHALQLDTKTYSTTKNLQNLFSVSFVPGMLMKEIEMNIIIATLKSHNGNKTHAAKSLGIGLRTLQRKVKQYEDMDPDFLLSAS